MLLDNREYIDVLNYLIKNPTRWKLVSKLKEKFHLNNSKLSYQQFVVNCSKKYGCGILESRCAVSIDKNGKRRYNSRSIRIVSTTIPDIQRVIAKLN